MRPTSSRSVRGRWCLLQTGAVRGMLARTRTALLLAAGADAVRAHAVNREHEPTALGVPACPLRRVIPRARGQGETRPRGLLSRKWAVGGCRRPAARSLGGVSGPGGRNERGPYGTACSACRRVVCEMVARGVLFPLGHFAFSHWDTSAEPRPSSSTTRAQGAHVTAEPNPDVDSPAWWTGARGSGRGESRTAVRALDHRQPRAAA